MALVSLRFLGTPLIERARLSVHLDTRKAVALLAYLVANGPAATRDTLVTLLWSRYGRKQGQSALRRTLSTLRRAVGPEALLTDGESIHLADSHTVESDLLRSRELLRRCDSHRHSANEVCRSCIPLLSEAAALHRGDFLQGFTLKDSVQFDDWQFFMTEDLHLELARILDRLSLCLAAAGDYEGAIAAARRRLGIDPLDEGAHATLVRCYAWSGNRAAALRQFSACRRILADEMQTKPGRELELLHHAIRAGSEPPPPRFSSAETTGLSEGRAPPTLAEWERESVVALRFPVAARSRMSLLSREIIERLDGGLRETGESAEGELAAVFGRRSDSESNPELAVRAALELLEAVREASLGVQIGVATGRSPRRGRGNGPRPGTAALVRASALAERCRSGSVLVDERTVRLTRSAFSYRKTAVRDTISVGRSPVYRLLGLAEVPRKTRGLPGRRTRLVGRDEELARLASAFARSRVEGGHVCVITGDAGIGKSRLIAELYERVLAGGEASRPLWLEGRCLPPTVSVAYFPLADMFRELFAREGDRLARIVEAGGDSGRETAPDSPMVGGREALREALHCARALVSGVRSNTHDTDPLSPVQAKERTFSSLVLLFRTLASMQPLVLIFEDLHWADELSLELIGELMGGLEGLPVLLVCIHRAGSEYANLRMASEAARRRPGRLTEIHLREMGRTESEHLLSGILSRSPLPNELRELVLRRAGGNPFFLEELANAFLQSAAAEIRGLEGGSAAGAAMADPGDLPETVKAVILSRVDRLPPAPKELLRVAAAIGRVFPLSLLDAAAGSGELGAVLDDLVTREFVFVERTLPQVEYSFNHVLTQEAVYRDLSASERADLHRKVAEAYLLIAGGDPERYCEQLADHFDRAGDGERAIEYYFRSGERARRLYANNAAVRHLSRGLELIRAAPRESRLRRRELEFLLALGVPLVLTRGHYAAEVETAYLQAREIAERIGTSEQLFQVMLGLRRLQFARGEHRDANDTGEAMLALARKADKPMLAARAHMMLCESLGSLGRFEAVIEHSRAGWELCGPEEFREHLFAFGNDTRVGLRLYEAVALWHLGFPDRARETADAAVARSREEDHAFTIVFALFHAALVAFMRREAERVADLAAEQVEVARRERFPLYTGFGPVLLGWSLGMLGEGKRGAAMIPEPFENLPHARPFGSLFACMRAELSWRRGRIGEAREVLDAGLASVRTCDAHLWEPELSRLRAEIGREAGELRVDTERWLARGLRIARSQGARSLELRALTTHCRLTHESSQLERLKGLYETFDEGLETEDLLEAARVLGEASGGSPDNNAADQAPDRRTADDRRPRGADG